MIFTDKPHWIWSDKVKQKYNAFVCFRRVIKLSDLPKRALLKITADTRYEVYVNGEWVGHGPIRSWLSPWSVDEYDLRHLLKAGDNVISVLVQHYGISTFQYIHSEPGMLAQLDLTDEQGSRSIVSDASWKCTPHDGYAWPVPRVSCQMGWEEQFDARSRVDEKGDWRTADYNDNDWLDAVETRQAGKAPHEEFESRDIPMLTREPIAPVRVLSYETVRPATYTWSLNFRDYINPGDKSANIIVSRMLLATYIYSEWAQKIEFHQPHWHCEWKINGQLLNFDDRTRLQTDEGIAHAHLKRGWNILLCRRPDAMHLASAMLNIWVGRSVTFSSSPVKDCKKGSPWLALGPFGDAPSENITSSEVGLSYGDVITSKDIHSEANCERFESIWQVGDLSEADWRASFARPLTDDMISPVDVFELCSSERVIEEKNPQVDEPNALQYDNADWTTIHPAKKGEDVRVLLDFGEEVVGYHEFEIDAPAGTILDNHNFEFIQRDGRINLAESMNNSFRYICRDGIQFYRTFLRRGFRYTWLTLRNFDRPIRIRFVRMLLSTYPMAQQGDFSCSDPMLEQIWHVGARSVKICAEDTYVDCPSYEQTHWVGDARNEALVDLTVNGDPRLSWHCWLQAARSLDRSPLVESQVPSGWKIILPAWSFLWMRWALEHYQLTGDKTKARQAIHFLNRNVSGIRQQRNNTGLFENTGWNMFDWAPMDTPPHGVVTHQNCLAVLGLRDAAKLAQLVASPAKAEEWNKLADELSEAINKHLWCDQHQAYVDCLHGEKHSTVFSQQTQTAAYISRVAKGSRAEHCRVIIEKAPPSFVKAGSPFFMFFLLEALVKEKRFDELVTKISNYWGPQIEEGATTFWEMYYPDDERKTRSHCHGWSAAPTFFLSQYILGIRPLEPGFTKVLIAPQPGQLKWAAGRVPTPQGVVSSRWKCDKGQFTLEIKLPPKTSARIELPFSGKIKVESGKVKKLGLRGKTTVVEVISNHVKLSVYEG